MNENDDETPAAELLWIKPGDRIEIRTAGGEWLPRIARSKPFLNRGMTLSGKPWLVVHVDHAGYDHYVNWPLADVRLVKGPDHD